MNSSKKARKNVKAQKKKQPKRNPKIWIISASILIVLLVGSILFDQLYQRVLLSINGDKYRQNDLGYYFYSVEAQYDSYVQFLGSRYWDMQIDQTSGKTVRDQAMDEAINSALYNEVMYREAVSAGYSLNADENETIATKVTSLLTDESTKNIMKKNKFKEAYLTTNIGKITLVERYQKDLIDALDIDDEAIKAEINFEDYKQYDIEYLFVSTKDVDEEGSSVDKSEEDKKEALSKINSYYEEAKASKDFSTILPEDEKDVVFNSDTFLDSDDKYTEDLEAKIMAMNIDEVSEVIEAENGYYIIRMVNNASTDSYDNAVKTAITNAETEAFNPVYSDILAKYDYKINGKALQRLVMGNITIRN